MATKGDSIQSIDSGQGKGNQFQIFNLIKK